MTKKLLLLYVTHIKLIAHVVLRLETACYGLKQTTILNVPWSRYRIIFVFHSGNYLQLLQQVSEYMKFWILLLKFSKYTLLSKNLMTCQAEIGSYVQSSSDLRKTAYRFFFPRIYCIFSG